MITALLSGSNIKRDGSIRIWDCAEYQGHHKKSKSGETILNVFELGKLKQINLSTFSGTIIDHDNEFTFIDGQKISKQSYYLPF